MRIVCDGSGNGHAAMVAFSEDGKTLSSQVKRGIAKTNNEAEYQALIMSLQFASKAQEKVTITIDSQLVYNQMKGTYQVKAENLQPLHRKALALWNRLPNVELEWKPRVNVSA